MTKVGRPRGPPRCSARVTSLSAAGFSCCGTPPPRCGEPSHPRRVMPLLCRETSVVLSAQLAGGQPMTRRPRSGLVPVVILPLLLVGCGLNSPSERDVCTQYRQFQASADALRQLNPQTATADQYRAAADKARADLNKVLASADGTLDTSI